MQPVEKLSYDDNSAVRFNTINRFETEIKWIKLSQSASHLGFNDNIYHEGNISKMPDFVVNRFKRAGYSLDMRQSACLVFNQIMVEGFAALFSCTAVVQASDSMTASM